MLSWLPLCTAVAVGNALGGRAPVAEFGNRVIDVRPDSEPGAVRGSITGRVTDAETGKGLAGVSVFLQGNQVVVLTDANGAFRMPGVPAGGYRVVARRIGYGSVDQPVVVRGNVEVSVAFELAVMPVRLEEVVTTVSGARRRYEVGNSITTINADSVVQTTPIRTLSDLLDGRVQGLDVQSTSGAVGSGSRIRIRGVSSITAGSDPIVIIDGIRADASFSQPITGAGTLATGVNQATGMSATSRLNDVDPENIETVEVLKGPSASTLYGSDAANGVIVITTKRGRPGPTRWSLFGQYATSRMDDENFPDAWRGWGSWPAQPGNTECPLAEEARGVCQQDSVTHFNPLNHAATSPLRTGYASRYGVGVSGGNTQVQYFVGGDYADELGVQRLSAFDREAFVTQRNGAALPDWVVRPNALNALHLNSTLSAQLARTADVTLTSGFVHQYHRDDASGTLVRDALLSLGYLDTLTGGWGNRSPGRGFILRSSDVINRGVGGLSGSWRPTPYLSAHGTAGGDYASRTDEGLIPTTILPGVTGSATQTTMRTLVRTVDLGAVADVPLLAGVRARSSVGGQYTREENDGESVGGTGLPEGSDVVNGAASTYAAQFHSASAINGWYLEQSLALNERAFMTAALRGDASSAFGSDAKSVYYPKWSASWLASQEPFFPRLPALDNLRLRAAFGHAGVQPSVDARFRSYRTSDGFVDGSSAGSLIVWTVGNPALRPERSTELEGGFDLGLWNERASLEFTTYRKVTRDALVSRTLPPSLGLPSRLENVGKVENRGLELQATVQPVVTPLVSWSAVVNFSRNRNRLVSLGPTTLPPLPTSFGASQNRYVPGYPLGGFWERPLLGYSDVNGNGIVERDEIRLGDSAVYRGQPSPKAEMALFNTLSFWSGSVSLSAGVNYTYGVTQLNGALWHQCQNGRCEAAQNPETSLRDQAYAVAAQLGGLRGSTWGFLETGSYARLSELSMTVAAPQRLARTFRAQGANVSLMGRNLALWSRYAGADPEVNTSILGNQLADAGGVPQPRDWTIRLNLRY